MYTLSVKLTFYMPQSSSLKDKRRVCRGLTDRIGSRFNASVAEVGARDFTQTLELGFAVVSGESSHARRMADDIIRNMEEYADAVLMDTVSQETKI